MNSRERFLAALKGEKPDRTPLAHVSALTTIELQELTGCYLPEAHHNPEVQAKLLFANHEILGFDAVSFIINYFNEPAALGCQMDWGDKRRLPMYLAHPWTVPEDAFLPDDLLDREPISSNCLETIRLAKKRYGDRVAILGKVMGPFSMVQVMVGLEKTIVAMVENPKIIRHFLDTAVEILIKCANSQFEAGIDALAIGEGELVLIWFRPGCTKSYYCRFTRR